MTENNRKKKQPEAVRANIMEAAAQAAIEGGLGRLTLDLVARKAGVSKGGLIHHYPSRQALIDSLFHTLLNVFQKNLDDFIRSDPESRGRFTRAYVQATARPGGSPAESKLLGAFALAMSNDSRLAGLWYDWLRSQMEKHGENTSSVIGRMVRYAADGLWLEACTGGNIYNIDERQVTVEHLISLTYSL